MRYQVMVAVCTTDFEYGKRLISYARRRGDYPFELQQFTDPAAAAVYHGKHRLAAVLLSEELYHKEDWSGFPGHLILLSGSALPGEELDTLYFYQSAEEILSGIAAGLLQAGVAEPKEYDRVEITGIFSGFYPAGGRSLAMGLASREAEHHRVLLAELTAWSPLEKQLDLEAAAGVSDLFYYLKSGREGLWMKLAGRCGDVSGIKFLGGPGDPGDLMQLTEKDWEDCFAHLRRQNMYDRIILLLGDAPVVTPVFFRGCDRVWLVNGNEPEGAYRKEQMERYLTGHDLKKPGIRWVDSDDAFDLTGTQSLMELSLSEKLQGRLGRILEGEASWEGDGYERP